MDTTKRNPGPAPTSCITCSRRKKKCDKSRPCCNRCRNGGYVCLGYDRGAGAKESNSTFSSLSKIRPIQNDTISTSIEQPQNAGFDSTWLHQSPCFTAIQNRPSSGHHGEESPSCGAQNLDNLGERALSSRVAAHFGVGYSLPPRFIPNRHISGLAAQFIMMQYEPMFELVLFRPIRVDVKIIRGKHLAQIMSSSMTYWSSYLAAQIFHTLKLHGEDASLERFVPWLNRLEQLCITLDDSNLDDMIGRLSGAMVLAHLNSLVSSPKNSYTLLRHTSFVFMQVAFADPTLWPRDPASNGISLAHVLASARFELGQFILTDTVISLAFGTPPLVEYDVSHPVIQTHGKHPFELLHGCATTFAFSIVRINQWRAQYPDKCTESDAPWKEIEGDAWSWRSDCDYGLDPESSRVVTRSAVQEGWRHGLLIYLYMGMCGVTNHDRRVQSSVRQISQLYNIIESEYAAGLHLMVPLLLAGICSTTEADRSKFRAAVSRSGHNKTSLLKGAEFARTLDHLWKGVGADGGPVTWNDYINSRRAVIDIGV